MKIWTENLSLFPEKWKPPLRLDKAFDYSQVKPEILECFKNGYLEIEKLSMYCYQLKIPDKNVSEFSDEALAHFEGSIVQKLMSESEF